MRPPCAWHSLSTHVHVGWDVLAEDWEAARTGAQGADDVVRGVLAFGDGAVVLLHAWPGSALELRSGRRPLQTTGPVRCYRRPDGRTGYRELDPPNRVVPGVRRVRGAAAGVEHL
jgi:hypothetical protein